jgi:uncharacterized metal-binding protein YceD (DUF177 family)
LFIEVNKIAPGGLEIDGPLSLPPVRQSVGDSAPVAEVGLAGWFERAGADVTFRGRVKATVTLACSRCLLPFQQKLDGVFHLIFRAGPLPLSRRDDDEDFALTPFDGQRIDLDELATEQIYLLLPLKPLCRSSCKGLCPRCGANRNLAECGCPRDPEGPEPLTSKIPL